MTINVRAPNLNADWPSFTIFRTIWLDYAYSSTKWELAIFFVHSKSYTRRQASKKEVQNSPSLFVYSLKVSFLGLPNLQLQHLKFLAINHVFRTIASVSSRFFQIALWSAFFSPICIWHLSFLFCVQTFPTSKRLSLWQLCANIAATRPMRWKVAEASSPRARKSPFVWQTPQICAETCWRWGYGFIIIMLLADLMSWWKMDEEVRLKILKRSWIEGKFSSSTICTIYAAFSVWTRLGSRPHSLWDVCVWFLLCQF